MTITYLSWDGDPDEAILPHRVSTDNMGGDDLEDDVANPPQQGDPNSASWNAKVRETAALAKTAAAAKVTINFSAGAPVFELWIAAGSITTDDLTLTDAGTGITELTWPENSFPPASVWPHGLTLHAEGTGFAVNITNGLRVTTKSLAETLTNIAFTVCIG
jgi:hypothetical protein